MKAKLILLSFLFTNIQFAQNVFIAVIDGARYTETFDSGSTHIPHMYDDLRPSGYLYTNFRIADEGKTETNPGHSTILSGTWQQIANDGSQRPTKPTTFEYFRKELSSSITDNYIIGGKAKLGILNYSNDPDYGSNFRASTICADVSDNIVYDSLISTMNTAHPKLILVSFSDTDRAGHSGNYSSYVNALTNADDLVYQLWQHIQAGDYGYTTANTTIFITNDHGRHTTNFSGHGDDCEGCEHIMLLALGRNVEQGVENSDLHHQIDIAPTVGYLLGFSTSQAVGVSLFEGSNPLPVELASFSVVVLEHAVKLNWRTETEVNNYGFEIERSQMANLLDGKAGVKDQTLDKWDVLGFVQGHGNSNSPKDYFFIDGNVTAGKHSYRLKQIDTDGQFEYSKVIEVNLGSPQKFQLSQNYPNPFNPSTTISFSLQQSGNVKLTVYNLLGEQVVVLVNGFKEAGIYTLNYNAENLNSGLYIYKIVANGFIQSRKMLLLK